MLPEGFPHLIAVTIENWDWDRLPQRDPDVWDALSTQFFWEEQSEVRKRIM